MEANNENKIKQEENLDADEEKLKQPITIIKNDIRFEDLQTFPQKYNLEMPIQTFIRNFGNGRQDVEDDSRPGRPSTSKTDENFEKVASLIRSDRRLSIRVIAETVNIDKECVRQILHDNLNMQKVCAEMVPKILTFEQQATRKNVCTDILDAIKNDPNLLEKVIKCDESLFFTYDPETKRQSMHWKTPTSPRAKKARMSKSKFKAMMIVFFDIHGIVYLHWVPEGQAINQRYYL
ncbi:putative mariner transposase [Trichonephila clavipes]|nr:putative mariner transposase [Trichonephila clavipes]